MSGMETIGLVVFLVVVGLGLRYFSSKRKSRSDPGAPDKDHPTK